MQDYRRTQGDPVQPDRPRPFRHECVRALLQWTTGGFFIPGGSDCKVSQEFAEGGLKSRLTLRCYIMTQTVGGSDLHPTARSGEHLPVRVSGPPNVYGSV